MRTVRSRFMLVAAVLLLATTATVSLRAQNAASSAPTARTQGEVSYLMLQDGGLVEGKITSAADWYIVVRPGGQMQVAKSRVVFACHTRDEAYAYRHAQIDSSKPGPHLSLAEWCLRYGLLTESEQELAEARRLDPDQPRLGLLERRLEKMRTQTTAKAVASIAPNAHAKNTIESTLKPSATIDLPDGVVERFTRKVQPILVNSCTTSACHQPGGRQSFQLDRAILRGEANRRSTMHNLEATLALVDRENPEQSQLLIIGRKKHGGMAGPIFGPRQEQAFKHVTEWVSLLAPSAAPPEDRDSIEESPAGVVPAESRNPRTQFASTNAVAEKSDVSTSDKKSNRTPLTKTATGSPVKEAADVEDDTPRTLRQPHHLLYGGRLEPWRPRDPFDPEIFNRRQLGKPEQLQGAEQMPTQQTQQLQTTPDPPR